MVDRRALHRLNNLCATIDINRLGQSQPTMLAWDLEIYKARWEAFGWQSLIVDGHSIPDLLAAYETASRSTDRPTIVLARTVKGNQTSQCSILPMPRVPGRPQH